MVMLHVPTLVVVNIFLLLMAMVTYLVILRWNPSVPGVRYWILGAFIQTASIFLIFLRTGPYLSLSSVAIDIVIVIGYYIIYMGFRKYGGKSPTDKTTLAPFLVFLVICIGLSIYVRESPTLLFIIVALATVMACMCFLIAFELFVIPLRTRFLTRWFAILVFLHGVSNLVRSVVMSNVFNASALLEGENLTRMTFIESMMIIFAFTVGYGLLISEHLLDQLKRQAEIDCLTGVFNRRAFVKLVEKNKASAKRNDSTLSLLSIDLDHFKNVNDTYGHAAGDAALRHFSSVITSSLRPGDILGRVGGEEFMVLLLDTGMSEALDIAERLRLKLEQSVVAFGKVRVKLTISLGVSSAPRGEKTFDLLAKESDIALYKAKGGGRNRVVVFQEGQ